MDLIKDFEIELDISDRQKLYDYGREQYVYRSVKGDWDLNGLRSRASDDHLKGDDENKLVRIRNMDGAIANFRMFEKDLDAEKEKKQEKEGAYAMFSSFNKLQGSQVLPRRVLPVYYPGEIVRGKVILELHHKMDAKAFTISFKGKADVQIQIYTGKRHRTDVGKEKYVDEEMTVWEKADSSSVFDQFSRLSFETVSRSQFIPPGRHEFGFSFTLPRHARHSTPSLLQSWTDFAYIAYRIKATIEKGKMGGRGNIAACRGIWVDKPCDVAHQPAELKLPITVQEKLDTGLFTTTGHALLTFSIPRIAYARGETIPIVLDMDNACSTDIKSIKAGVHLAGQCRCGSGPFRGRTLVDIKSVKRQTGPIKGNVRQRFSFDLPLDFSESIVDSNLIPVGNLDECQLIDVFYELVVKVKRSSLHRNLEATIPIFICTSNSEINK